MVYTEYVVVPATQPSLYFEAFSVEVTNGIVVPSKTSHFPQGAAHSASMSEPVCSARPETAARGARLVYELRGFFSLSIFDAPSVTRNPIPTWLDELRPIVSFESTIADARSDRIHQD